jgi:uncharacterized protein with HEPN domain
VNERDRLFLGHILDAIADIEDFVVDGRTAFMVDRRTQSAVVRQIEIIGEAVKNLSPELKAAETKVPWRQIAGTRDRLIRAYFKVDFDAVWAMIEQDLPPLRDNIELIVGGA